MPRVGPRRFAKLRRFLKTATPTTTFKLSDDPDDKILECAHAAKADHIVKTAPVRYPW